MNENLHGDDVQFLKSKERDWKLSDLSTDSRTKLEEFYVNHKQFFKKRREKLIIQELKEEHGEDAEFSGAEIDEALDVNFEEYNLSENAELVEEAFMLIGISE